MKRLELIVSIETILENARAIRERVSPNVRMLAVVKANAYGHGAVQVARALDGAHLADAFAVATPEEGAEIRSAVGRTPVVVLGCAGDDAALSVEYGLSQAVYCADDLNALESEAVRRGTDAIAHLKIDTGMSRIGVRGADELTALLDVWARCPHVRMEGMFTHFCVADEDAAFTQSQARAFREAAALVAERGFSPVRHAAASTAMLNPDYGFDMVRAGIALYGTGVMELAGIVKPAQTLVSHPVRVFKIDTGDTVGYGRTFTALRPTTVITVPCGYGDGYPRALSHHASVLVNGKRIPIIGNVCMDMLMADATDAGEVTRETPVVLLGAQGNERITPDELAEMSGTIPYEIMLGFGNRVSRTWL